MARVRFTEDYDYWPTSQSVIEYKAGMELTVKRECADAAVAAGKAKELRKPSRQPSPPSPLSVESETDALSTP